jgi:hypothetical protein
MDFEAYPFLKKYLDTFKDDHPPLIQFDLNPDFMNYVEKLLAEIDNMSNLKMKIEEMRDSSNWESAFSELEFARKLKELNPEFVRTRNGYPTPDIRANILGEDVFFEVKLLVENDAATCVSHEIWKIESDLIVKIDYGNCEMFDNEKACRLIDFIRNKINAKEIGSYVFEGINVEIANKKTIKTKRTELIISCTFEIPMESIRKKVFKDFDDKLNQFRSCSPIFWVIDCQKWKCSTDCLASIANELFLQAEAKCLNGIIAIVHENTHLFVNYFAKQQINSESIRKLNELLQN